MIIPMVSVAAVAPFRLSSQRSWAPGSFPQMYEPDGWLTNGRGANNGVENGAALNGIKMSQ